MAPSSNRRPGYSRKAQYGLFATYVLAIAGTFFAALLLLISIVDPKGFEALRNAGNEITSPVARFFNSIRQSVNDINRNTSAYFDAASKNRALEDQVERNKTKLIEAKAIKVENLRLRALLQIAEVDAAKPLVARLISSTSASSRRIGILSKGSLDGVTSGQPVRGPSGLVGRVLSVGPTTARVLLISDSDNLVPVMRNTDGLSAFLSGNANGTLSIKPVNFGVNDFKKGDVFVTSGNGGLYPPNIPVARIVKKTVDGGLGVSLSDPAATPYVITLPVYQAPAVAALEKAQAESQLPMGAEE